MERTRLDPAVPAPRAPLDPLHDVRAVGEFRILRQLGEGGMGAVYLAYDDQRNRQVALKVLADHLASNQAYVDRFYREARSGLSLDHPNIVRCYQVARDKTTGKHYLVLEYVDGPSAQALLERLGRLEIGDAVHIALDIARGLEHAHSRNIIHRDIKPGNILSTQAGVSKLADLGLAKRTDENSHLTATRQGFGTPHYMPYEQALNAKHADHRSDIYALGATLYHLLTGDVPFEGESHLDVVEKKSQGGFVPASDRRVGIPPVLDQILARMLARNPDDRYQTASELIVDLERSALAAAVPSFADHELAMNDPWVQTCMASNQATRPDLETPNGKPTPPKRTRVWQLRFRDPKGEWKKVRATTQQVLRKLQTGRLPSPLEASPLGGKVFRPLTAYPEFRKVINARKQTPTPAAETQAEPVLGILRRWFLFGAGLFGLSLVAIVGYILLR